MLDQAEERFQKIEVMYRKGRHRMVLLLRESVQEMNKYVNKEHSHFASQRMTDLSSDCSRIVGCLCRLTTSLCETVMGPHCELELKIALRMEEMVCDSLGKKWRGKASGQRLKRVMPLTCVIRRMNERLMPAEDNRKSKKNGFVLAATSSTHR